MSKYVYAFAEGNKDLKDLLGGKGANLAEMAGMGLPVPPGFIVSTEACRAYLDTGTLPAELSAQVDEHLIALEKAMGKTPRRPRGPAARRGPVGVEVLDARNDGDRPGRRPERQFGDRAREGLRRRAVRVGLLPAPDPDVRQDRSRDRGRTFRRGVRRRQEVPRHHQRPGPGRVGPAAGRRVLQGRGPRAGRPGVPAGPAGAVGPGDQRRLPLVELAARPALPAPRAHSGQPGHRGQRHGDGVRQPGPRLGLRRRLHPRPGHRRARHLR